MKVFVTGGTGFIGSHIVIELLSRGHEVTILARNPAKIPAFRDMPGIQLVQGTLDDIGVIREALGGQDVCIHNSVYWEDEPTELQLKDSRTSVQIFEAAASAGVKQLIYTSSTAVHRPFLPRMDETQRLAPTDFYGATKAANEAFLAAFSYQTSMRCNIVRPGPTVGVPAIEGASVNADRRFGEVVQAALRNEEIHVEGARQFTPVGGLAALYAALVDSYKNRETYIAVAKESTTWRRIAELAVNLTGSSSQIVEENVPEHVFDVSKIKDHFGIELDAEPAITGYLRRLAQS